MKKCSKFYYWIRTTDIHYQQARHQEIVKYVVKDRREGYIFQSDAQIPQPSVEERFLEPGFVVAFHIEHALPDET